MSDQHPADDETTSRDELLKYLQANDISTTPVVTYPAHNTIEEGKQLRGDLPGHFTKNLLLKDKKGALFFVVAHEDTDIDLKTLHTTIGARGRLGFASPETMNELLHVSPGTATPLALIHDTGGAVTLIVDQRLEGSDQVNFHPMTHTESIGLSWDNFIRFGGCCDHPPTTAQLHTHQ